MKTCSQCNQEKALTEFYRRGTGYRADCIECGKAAIAKYRLSNADKIYKTQQANRASGSRHKDYMREYNRLKRYGMESGIFEELFEQQGRKCPLCGRGEPLDRRFWHVDHDHQTGEIRGVLCHFCNLMLGHAMDRPEVLVNGALYLGIGAT